MRHAHAFALGLAVTAGCAIGAPPGFSPGDQYTFPLVDPLEGGRLIVPVMVHGHGPYLFAIDRDANTVIDAQVAVEVGVHATGGVRLVDHNDTTHQAFFGELTDVEVGTLTVSLVHVAITAKAHVFDDNGRRIHGILGREFLADSMVFGFDRARGIAWLATQQRFTPPAGASVLELAKVANNGAKVLAQPVLQDAKVGGAVVDIHPNFGEVTSSFAVDRWDAAHLQPLAWDLPVIDASGTRHHIDRVGLGQVTVNGVARERVAFAPYDDRRFPLYHLDGTLGLDFFRQFSVAADWHHQKIYVRALETVAATLATRMARWGTAISTCGNLGCVQLETAVNDVGPILMVRPDAGQTHDLEVIVTATAATGEPLPSLELNLPARSEGFDAKLEPRYAGAKFEVVDASPFPRPCPTTRGCMLVESPLSP